MIDFESRPGTTSSNEPNEEQLDDSIPYHLQNDAYRDYIDLLVEEGKSFDEIRAELIEANIPGAQTIENAEAYQPLLDRLTPGQEIIFQHHGRKLHGVINDDTLPRMRIDTVLMHYEPHTVAIVDIPIEHAGETDILPFYPRRSHGPDESEEPTFSQPKKAEPEEKLEVLLPGIELL